MLAATPLLRLYARWRYRRLGGPRPAAVQEAELMRLVRKAAATRFGRDHDFARIGGVSDFQTRVPLRAFDDFWRDYWQADFPRLTDCSWPGTIRYFARTAGTTTGITKYIPCSRDMLEANQRAAWAVVLLHLLNRPRSRVLGGKVLMLGGSTDLRPEGPDIYSADLSGLQTHEAPAWARRYVFPPPELALLTDWEEKIDRIARGSLSEDIRAVTGTPSWLLVFFDKLAELRPDVRQRLVSYYPGLELIVHGGIDFRPYAGRFSELLEGSHAELREVYAASEGFIAIADRGPDEGMRLMLDNGLFYEFIPAGELGGTAPRRFWLGDVEPGVEYALALSNCAGAWGYLLGDTVRFVELDPPRILVTGRTSYVLSAFGEHLIDAEIEEAVSAAAEAIGAAVADFCVAPVFPRSMGAKGRHRYVVEFIEPVDAAARLAAARLAAFGKALDLRLCELNADYATRRVGDYGLLPPEVEAVAPGSFRAWMKQRGKLGGQHKVPRVINDTELFASLQASVSSAGAGPEAPNRR